MLFSCTKNLIKIDAKAVFGHMIGYVNEKDGYRIWIPSQHKVITSHDIRFKTEKLCNALHDVYLELEKPEIQGEKVYHGIDDQKKKS